MSTLRHPIRKPGNDVGILAMTAGSLVFGINPLPI
jgi:hypothetical protein